MMTLTKAIALLENVEEMKSPIPFRRHKLKVGHRSELVGFPSGSYPVKAAKSILSILRNLQANCEFKGLDPEHVRLVHSSALAGRVLKDFVPEPTEVAALTFMFWSTSNSSGENSDVRI